MNNELATWRYRKSAIFRLILLCETSPQYMSETHHIVYSFHIPWIKRTWHIKWNCFHQRKRFCKDLLVWSTATYEGFSVVLDLEILPFYPWNMLKFISIQRNFHTFNLDATALGNLCCLHFWLQDYLGLLAEFFLFDFFSICSVWAHRGRPHLLFYHSRLQNWRQIRKSLFTLIFHLLWIPADNFLTHSLILIKFWQFLYHHISIWFLNNLRERIIDCPDFYEHSSDYSFFCDTLYILFSWYTRMLIRINFRAYIIFAHPGRVKFQKNFRADFYSRTVTIEYKRYRES